MKKAVIVAGPHHAGKSKTINEYLKPMLGIGHDDHKFILNGMRGYILSQSFEESLREFLAYTEKYFRYGMLVFAARPEAEQGSKLGLIRDALQKAGYAVTVVAIEKDTDAPAKAKEVFAILNAN